MNDLIEGFHITLNGINAEVYKSPDGVLLSNNDFSAMDLDFDEMILPYAEFKKQLFENNGAFTTPPKWVDYRKTG